MQSRSGQTKEKIKNAAKEKFAQEGYDATGVAGICQKAGISKGAFYHHFSSKQDLFIELLTDWLNELHIHLDRIRDQAESTPEAFLLMAEKVKDIMEIGGEQLQIFLEFMSKASRNPVIWQATILPYRQYSDFFSDMIRHGIREGTFRPVDTDLISKIMVSLAIGILFQGILDPENADWIKILREAIRLVMSGIQNKTDSKENLK